MAAGLVFPICLGGGRGTLGRNEGIMASQNAMNKIVATSPAPARGAPWRTCTP
jgi:hypothetical protein